MNRRNFLKNIPILASLPFLGGLIADKQEDDLLGWVDTSDWVLPDSDEIDLILFKTNDTTSLYASHYDNLQTQRISSDNWYKFWKLQSS